MRPERKAAMLFLVIGVLALAGAAVLAVDTARFLERASVVFRG